MGCYEGLAKCQTLCCLICFVVNASYQVPSIILLLYEKISILNSYELYNSSNTQGGFRYELINSREKISVCKMGRNY